MGKRYIAALAAILFLTGGSLDAQTRLRPVTFRGILDSYNAMRVTHDNRWMSCRTRARCELDVRKSNTSGFAAANLLYNPVEHDEPFIELREAYLDYMGTHFGVRAGRQIVVLGIADGIRLLDLITPMDMTEFLAKDYDDIQQPVNACRVYYFNSWLRVEAIAVPTFQAYQLPMEESSPWSMRPKSSVPLIFTEPEQPKFNFQNVEWAGQVAFTLPGVDLTFIYLYGWNKAPVFRYTPLPGSLQVDELHRRMTTFGSCASIPIKSTVLRLEGAFTPQKLLDGPFGKGPMRKPLVEGLVGLDWYAPRHWMLSVQGVFTHVFKYSAEEVLRDRQTLMATLRLSKRLLGETLEFASMGYFDLLNRGIFERFSVSYALTDSFHLSGGYDLFAGKKGMFHFYDDNDLVWLKLGLFF